MAGAGFLRSAIYAVKRRLINKHIFLYGVVYFIFTLNLDYLKQLLSKKRYPSEFGGQWTDRDDFAEILQKKLSRGLVPAEAKENLEKWRKDGFLIIENAIPPELISQLNSEMDQLPNSYPKGLKMTGPKFANGAPYAPDMIKPHESIRVVDYYFFSDSAKKILFSKPVIDFIGLVFDAEPVLTQSLSFEYGSEQPLHQDTAFVIMNSPMKMVGVWIALEDVQPGSGELLYYPGSHLWPDFKFSGRFKHFDKERDGYDQLDLWYRWMHEEAKKRNLEVRSFLPKKGDVLLWHAGLIHGGAPIVEPNKTRRSLVGHYCAEGVRPLYHYYNSGQRAFYKYDGNTYTSSCYR